MPKKSKKRGEVPAHLMAMAYPSGSDEDGSDDDAPKTLSIASGVGMSVRAEGRRQKRIDDYGAESEDFRWCVEEKLIYLATFGLEDQLREGL